MVGLDSVLAEIRSEVCDTVLKWTAVIGSIAVFLSLSRVFEFGFLPIMALHVGMVALLISTYAMRREVPYLVRASLIVLVMYAVAVAGHISFGTPTRIEFFVAASIMATVFFGEKIGLLIAGACIAALVAIYVGFRFELLSPPLPLPLNSPTSWITNGGSMLLAALAPLLAVNRYRRYLHKERERVVAASRAKSDFLATMSHELRTPMTAILGMTELLLSADLPASERQKAFRIDKAGRLLLDILNDILDFSKIEANKITINPGPFSPRELIEDVQGLLAPVAAQKGIKLSVACSDALPERVTADAGRVRQVVLNLVGNAVKFTDRGGVAVRLCHEYAGNTDRLKIEVEDTGIGISRTQQAQLFQPFYQVDQTGARRFGGTGLGLSICRRLVDLMGGTIDVKSEENRGSTFTATIPVAECRTSSSLVHAADTRPRTGSTRPLKLLVAEDNESIAFLMNTMLRKWGHEVDIVGDGKAALAAASAKYDVILMDMQMPYMDGATATREIRKRTDSSKDVPIIAVTADVAGEHAQEYMQAGVNALVAKPVDWAELAFLLNRFSDRRSSPPINHGVKATDRTEVPQVLDNAVIAELHSAIGDEAFGSLIVSFTNNVAELRLEIERSADAADVTATKKTAHSLKGLSLQFGAREVARIAVAIEQKPDSVGELVIPLKHEISRAEQALAGLRIASASDGMRHP